MNLGAILVGLAILIVCVPYVLNPLLNEQKKQPGKVPAKNRDGKDQEKPALAAIRDLDFDFQTGKVSLEDYETVRSQLVQEAAEALQKQIKEDEKIEALIRTRSGNGRTGGSHSQTNQASARCEQCNGVLRPQDRFCPTCGVPVKNAGEVEEQTAQIACPRCGLSVQPGDLFCTGCGSRMMDTAAS